MSETNRPAEGLLSAFPQGHFHEADYQLIKVNEANYRVFKDCLYEFDYQVLKDYFNEADY
jgi:hypothetical protein